LGDGTHVRLLPKLANDSAKRMPTVFIVPRPCWPIRRSPSDSAPPPDPIAAGRRPGHRPTDLEGRCSSASSKSGSSWKPSPSLLPAKPPNAPPPPGVPAACCRFCDLVRLSCQFIRALTGIGPRLWKNVAVFHVRLSVRIRSSEHTGCRRRHKERRQAVRWRFFDRTARICRTNRLRDVPGRRQWREECRAPSPESRHPPRCPALHQPGALGRSTSSLLDWNLRGSIPRRAPFFPLPVAEVQEEFVDFDGGRLACEISAEADQELPKMGQSPPTARELRANHSGTRKSLPEWADWVELSEQVATRPARMHSAQQNAGRLDGRVGTIAGRHAC
jgi:hypothetical protein